MKVVDTSIGRVLLYPGQRYFEEGLRGPSMAQLAKRYSCACVLLLGDKVDAETLPLEDVEGLIAQMQKQIGLETAQ